MVADRYHGLYVLYWLDARSRAGFPNLSETDILTFFAMVIILYIVKMLTRIPSLYPLDANSTPDPGDNQK